jgi:ABC transporter DrrB family efflux protein
VTRPAETAIEVRDLRRSYGGLEAVRGISFDVRAGEVFCLLGPNGAGKTTTVEILEGYRTRSGGEVRVLGMDPARGQRAFHERVGIVLQQCGVQGDLTVAELVEMYGRYYSRRRQVDEVIDLVELSPSRDVRAKQLSGGQRRRLDLALALVGDADLIFLDEPTTGFDPAARRQAWSTIRSLCELGKTIFLTTHFMDEAQHLGPTPWRRDFGLVAWQIRYEQRAYWRNRGRGIFTFVFPLMFLVIFASLNQGQTLHSRGGIAYNDFFVPGILAYGVIATSFVNMAIGTAILRDEGILKRMQGTPLPRWAYIAARIGSTVAIVTMMTVITLGLGVVAYGVQLRASTLPGLILTLALGTAAFTTLGIGITRFIPNAEAAPVVVNLTVLPLTFISSIWFPSDTMPTDIAKVFPMRPLADGLQYAFDPRTSGGGLNGSDLRSLLVWTAVGVFLMVRFLRQPQGERA